MSRLRQKTTARLELISRALTNWLGSVESLVIHSILFVTIFSLRFLGFDFNQILLILTTLVSLEAIYLSIFIQMTVNRHSESLAEVEEDIEGIQEEVHELEEDLTEISKDIQEDEEVQDTQSIRMTTTLEKIESELQKLLVDIEALKKK